MKIEQKWSKDEALFKRITNADFDCKNCTFRFDDSEIYGNTSKCEKFPKIKPISVLKKGKCPVKERE